MEVKSEMALDKTMNRIADAIENASVYPEVVDALDSTSTDKPLSANQGKVLKGLVDTNANAIASLNWTFLETVTGTNTADLPSGWVALRLIASYTDDTIPFEITKEEYDKCTNGTQIALSGGSLVRSTAVIVTTTTAGIAWFRTATTSTGGNVTNVQEVTSSSKLHVFYR